MTNQRRRLGRMLVVAIMALLATGCTPRQSTVVGPHPGSSAPEFQMTLMDGNTIELATLRGRPIVLNFWASWCGPCKREMPLLQDIHAGTQVGDLSVLAINYGEDQRTVTDLVDEGGYTFAVGLDSELDLARMYLVQGMPTTFFIDADGVIQQIHIGELSEELLRENVEKLARN